jgi:hypothetical protein
VNGVSNAALFPARAIGGEIRLALMTIGVHRRSFDLILDRMVQASRPRGRRLWFVEAILLYGDRTDFCFCILASLYGTVVARHGSLPVEWVQRHWEKKVWHSKPMSNVLVNHPSQSARNDAVEASYAAKQGDAGAQVLSRCLIWL